MNSYSKKNKEGIVAILSSFNSLVHSVTPPHLTHTLPTITWYKGKTGLMNHINTCYMNSVVQCLASVAPLRNFFLCTDFSDELSKLFKDVLKDIWVGGKAVIGLKHFVDEVKKLYPEVEKSFFPIFSFN